MTKKVRPYMERRTHARRSVIESQLISVELGDNARGVLIDVGEGGVAVQPFVPLPVGAESDLFFETPSGTRVKAHGMVAWVGENGRTGIRFTEVEPEAREEIRRWAETDIGDNADENLKGLSLPGLTRQDEQSTRNGSEVAVSAGYLTDIAQRAMEMTKADGAALAMSEANEIRCVARVGNAPDPGVTVRRGEGLAGMCLLLAQPLLCPDALSDRRAKREAALALNIRSCAMAPIIEGGTVSGVVAVFSSEVDVFSEDDLAGLVELVKELVVVG